MSQVPWWKTAVFYQIYPRSFLDTDGDGVGDLEGIRRRLPALKELGVDAVWLSPFYRSPMADFGYDVADYCDVDPLFGALSDFDRMLADAHALGLRVIIDFVPNHTSDQHPWFADNQHRDWYVWRDGTPDQPPNAWPAAWGDIPAWTWDGASQQWYLHLFLPQQPDLDWTNPEVEEAMHGVLRFWLDRGVDGFRVDVVHLIGKDIPTGPDAAPYPEPTPTTHALLRRLRALLDGYDHQPMMVGEVYILSTRRVAEFYGDDDELHLSFNFLPLHAPWEADAWRRRIDRMAAEFDPRGAWPTWVLSNHDVVRHRTRYGSAAKAASACLVLLGLRGTPFLYAGEELGLQDATIPPDRVVDPGGRDGCRGPIPWEDGPTHGWATPDPWLPWPPPADPTFVDLYRRALAARRASPALQLGSFTWLASPDGVLAWRRDHDGDAMAVVVNMTDTPVALSPLLPPDALLVLGAGADEGEATFPDAITPWSAVWVQLADNSAPRG